MGWYDFRKFDYKTYERHHKLDFGDMNWIIPGKILALSSPVSNAKQNEGLPPEAFIENFETMNITGIIRLNELLYDPEVFENEGIRVHNLEFLDGSCPPDVRPLISITDYSL